MKHFKKIALLLMAAAFLAVLPSANTLKVSAAEPTTHLIVYDAEDNHWSCYVGGSNLEDAQPADHWETYYLQQNFKDGDILVIQSDDSASLELDLGNHNISNLTITSGSKGIVIVKAGSIDECYLLEGSVSSITGTIENAYVYNTARVTFCSDIDTLHVMDTGVEVHATIGSQGTVNHVIAKDDTWVRYEFYSVAKGKLHIENGRWETEEGYFSTTPSATASSSKKASNAYDKVPKTGDSNSIALWFVIAAICCAGGITVLKKTTY